MTKTHVTGQEILCWPRISAGYHRLDLVARCARFASRCSQLAVGVGDADQVEVDQGQLADAGARERLGGTDERRSSEVSTRS